MLDKIIFIGGTEEQNEILKNSFCEYAKKKIEKEDKNKCARTSKRSLSDHPRYQEKVALRKELDSLKKKIDSCARVAIQKSINKYDNIDQLLNCPETINLEDEYKNLVTKYNEVAIKFNSIDLESVSE